MLFICCQSWMRTRTALHLGWCWGFIHNFWSKYHIPSYHFKSTVFFLIWWKMLSLWIIRIELRCTRSYHSVFLKFLDLLSSLWIELRFQLSPTKLHQFFGVFASLVRENQHYTVISRVVERMRQPNQSKIRIPQVGCKEILRCQNLSKGWQMIVMGSI